jgi:hypothetical protein
MDWCVSLVDYDFVTTLFNYVRNDWDAKVVMERVIRHVPWCICHCSEYLRLEPLYDVDVRLASTAPLLNPIGPYGFYRDFV